MQAFAVNHDAVPTEIRVERSRFTLVIAAEEKTKIRRELLEPMQAGKWYEIILAPPGQKVTCFDSMVSTGLRWGSGCILARDSVKISWTTYVGKGDRREAQTVASKAFRILLENPDKKRTDFTVKGLQVELKAARGQVSSGQEVSFWVKLRNVTNEAIRISGRQGFDDNYCCFLIYGPGDQLPILQVVLWPTKGTDGFLVPPGEAVEREFKAAWGVEDHLVPGPGWHMGHEKKETTFLKKGTHHVVVYFHGEDNSTRKDAWTGYARSNAVTVDLVDGK
jgi:hypothetical protein